MPMAGAQTTNAFVIYAAATAFILWAAYRGRLVGASRLRRRR